MNYSIDGRVIESFVNRPFFCKQICSKTLIFFLEIYSSFIVPVNIVLLAKKMR
jgi:hypothetical protein